MGRAALEEGCSGACLLIFAARAGDAGEQARLQAQVTRDRDFQRMALAVARSLRASAGASPEPRDQAARVEALGTKQKNR